MMMDRYNAYVEWSYNYVDWTPASVSCTTGRGPVENIVWCVSEHVASNSSYIWLAAINMYVLEVMTAAVVDVKTII